MDLVYIFFIFSPFLSAISCKVKSSISFNDKFINIIKDIDYNIYNFNKYSKNKSLLNKYKVNIDDENNGFILRIY